MKLLTAVLAAVLFANIAFSIDRKPSSEISPDDLTDETQTFPETSQDHVCLLWWIPVEFWTATISSDPTIDKATADLILGTLENYMIIAGVQADIDNVGNFFFYNEAEFTKTFTVEYVDGKENSVTLTPATNRDETLEELLKALKPVLSNAMGNMGSNFHFLVYPAKVNGTRLVDPYTQGELKYKLESKTGEKIDANLEFPLNSLYFPRKCPNGKDAHISWKYCPWTGEKLPE